MATSEGVEESLDFDFFETPRHQNEDILSKASNGSEPQSPTEKNNALPKSNSPRQDISSKSASGKKSAGNAKATHSYSSDSASEVDASINKKRIKGKKKTKSRSSPSDSSLSSVSSDNSFSKRPRSLSKTDSEEEHSNMSKSYSSFSSNSDTERSVDGKEKTTRSDLPKRGKSRMGEDEYDSSAYSEGEDDSYLKSPTTSHKKQTQSKDAAKKENSTHKQAWGDDPPTPEYKKTRKDTKKSRPKSAKPRVSQSTHLIPTSSSKRVRGGPAKSASDTLSDSDITDVSPMDSPRLQARTSDSNGKTRGRGNRVNSAGDGAVGDKVHKFLALPIRDLDLHEDGGDDSEPAKQGRDASGLDLDILMKAVGELEKQKRVEANSRRVMFAPMGASREKNNYTFDQGKTRDIERENQRLLNEIVRRVNSTSDQKKQFYASPKPTYKLTPSAINREREMKRIESENVAFLKRLQKVKPTMAICRDHQLRSYENTTLHGVSIAALHPLPGRNSRGISDSTSNYGRRRSGAASVADSASSIGSRTRSMTSIHSGISSVRSSKRGSRPSSATVRPGSATKRVDTRPEWTDRW